MKFISPLDLLEPLIASIEKEKKEELRVLIASMELRQANPFLCLSFCHSNRRDKDSFAVRKVKKIGAQEHCDPQFHFARK